jgi:hypothetical protein
LHRLLIMPTGEQFPNRRDDPRMKVKTVQGTNRTLRRVAEFR